MNLIRFALPIIFSIVFFACGINEKLSNANIIHDSGLISQVMVENNQLFVKATEDIHLRFEYYCRIDNKDKHLGWSVKGLDDVFNISIPCKYEDSQYYIKVRAENSNAFQDTVFYFYASPSNFSFLEMHFIDVEQGDATYIKTPENYSIIIDGGYGTRGSSKLDWQGFGQPLALNYINSLGIDHFNYIIETHHHADHYGGLSDIKNSNTYTWDYELSNNNTYNYVVGQNLELDSDVQFKILNIGYPPGQSNSGINNTSIVLKVNYGYADFLLTGDAEGVVQNYMMQNSMELKADLFKISHHGSSSNGTCNTKFLNTVFNKDTKIGIISFGTNNPYGHPKALYRFSDYYVFGTGTPPDQSPYQNHYFNCGNIITYCDGQAIIISIDNN